MRKYLLLAILSIAVLSACTQVNTTEQKATAYFSISDPGMSLDGVTAIDLTVSKITLHNQDTDSWIDVMSTENTFNLMQLKADQVKELVGVLNLSPGNYNQVRLDVSKVMVTYNGTTSEAKLPSNVLKVNVDMRITNESVLLNLDFKAEESLHTTGEGKIIMAPVINVEKYEGVEVQRQGKNIEVKNSKAKNQERVGMDEKGEMGKDKIISPETLLTTDETGKVVVEEKKPETQIPKGTGKAIFTVKDKNDNNKTGNETNPNNQTNRTKTVKTTSGLNVSSLTVTITNLSVHKAGDNESSWINIGISPLTVDLLQLQDVEAVVGEMNLPVGQYTQIRVDVSDAKGNVNGKDVNITIPSKTLKLVGVLKIDESMTSLATIDFVVEKSLTRAGSKYILKPVIKLTTRTGVTVKNREKKGGHEEIQYEAENNTESSEITSE
jgi:hypothetical protein